MKTHIFRTYILVLLFHMGSCFGVEPCVGLSGPQEIPLYEAVGWNNLPVISFTVEETGTVQVSIHWSQDFEQRITTVFPVGSYGSNEVWIYPVEIGRKPDFLQSLEQPCILTVADGKYTLKIHLGALP